MESCLEGIVEIPVSHWFMLSVACWLLFETFSNLEWLCVTKTASYYFLIYKTFQWSCCRIRINLLLWNYTYERQNYICIVLEEKYTSNWFRKYYFTVALHSWALLFFCSIVPFSNFSSVENGFAYLCEIHFIWKLCFMHNDTYF